ncbi:protein of unknown function [Methylocaldum szegediense]|uniref:Peptidase M14 domain-containing protein n=1 Tax=Methylocaldum szegediense TaxID=73780 RepID=A0ABM9HZG7_9GAMM|nr:protein of unknown function [Methylocaldum szegediense]
MLPCSCRRAPEGRSAGSGRVRPNLIRIRPAPAEPLCRAYPCPTLPKANRRPSNPPVMRALPELRELSILAEHVENAGWDWARVEVLAELHRDGESFPLLAFRFGPPHPVLPTLALFGGVHGLERIGTQVVTSYLHTLVEMARWDRVTRDMLSTTRLLIMPLVNPVGMYLKRRSNGNRVDLMRNAPVRAEGVSRWHLFAGHRISPRLPWYQGEENAPMEVEAQTLCDWVRREIFPSRTALSIDVHSGYGKVDRLWFPFAKSREPFPALAQTVALTIASPFFAKPFGTSESPKGAKNWRRVIAFGAPAVPARLVRTQRGVRTPLADDSTPGRDALCKTYDRRYRVDLRSHTRRSGFRGLLDSLAHSLHVSQRTSDRHDPSQPRLLHRAAIPPLSRPRGLVGLSLRGIPSRPTGGALHSVHAGTGFVALGEEELVTSFLRPWFLQPPPPPPSAADAKTPSPPVRSLPPRCPLTGTLDQTRRSRARTVAAAGIGVVVCEELNKVPLALKPLLPKPASSRAVFMNSATPPTRGTANGASSPAWSLAAKPPIPASW